MYQSLVCLYQAMGTHFVCTYNGHMPGELNYYSHDYYIFSHTQPCQIYCAMMRTVYKLHLAFCSNGATYMI